MTSVVADDMAPGELRADLRLRFRDTHVIRKTGNREKHTLVHEPADMLFSGASPPGYFLYITFAEIECRPKDGRRNVSGENDNLTCAVIQRFYRISALRHIFTLQIFSEKRILSEYAHHEPVGLLHLFSADPFERENVRSAQIAVAQSEFTDLFGQNRERPALRTFRRRINALPVACRVFRHQTKRESPKRQDSQRQQQSFFHAVFLT